MARRTIAEDDEPLKIELSPMIDCIFILLIFFIVTTVFVEESGLEVHKPEAGGSASLDNENVQIDITAENKVLFRGQSIGINGVQSRIKKSLTSEETPVIIMAHEKSDYGVLARVWGEARAAGAVMLTYNISK